MVSLPLVRPTLCKERKPSQVSFLEWSRYVSCNTYARRAYHFALQAMFLHKAALQRSSVELAVSYMEIYKDEVYDLLVNRESVRYIPVQGCASM